MPRLIVRGPFALVGLLVLCCSAWGAAPDWPQFRGPQRDGKSTETGLMKEWPEGGPKLLWKTNGLGRGYSTVSIVGDKIFTTGDRVQDGEEAQCVMAFSLADQKLLWTTPIGPPHREGGPRSTPTVDGALLYVIGTDGDLVCAESDSGKIRWRKRFAKDFGGKMMSVWRFSESPTVDGQKLVCTPGGPQAMMVALDKASGKVIWKCTMPQIGSKGKDGAGYSSIVVAEIVGVRQYVQMVGRGVIGVDAKTGKFLWGYNPVANPVANITSPVVKDDYVFATTSYKTGCALLKIERDGEKFQANEVYFKDFEHFANHHGGVILVGDHLYGGDGQNKGTLCCLELLTGKLAYKEPPLGKRSAAVLFADGQLYYRYEDGLVALVDATPDGLKLRGKFQAPVSDGPSWAHPVIHDGKLYLRAHDTLMCYDVRGR